MLGIALASLFSDWSHEIATAILPTFLNSLGATAAWLGLIEGISDGLSSFAKLGSGFYTDGLSRRKPIAFVGYLVTTLATAAFGFATAPWHVLNCTRRSVAWTRGSHASAEGIVSCCSRSFHIWTRLRL
jgi:hypothetical protein